MLLRGKRRLRRLTEQKRDRKSKQGVDQALLYTVQ
jgi:hypothetical protein